MSWTLGNKRWTVPFVSKNGTSCRVDIYKRDYTGSTVTTLSNASGSVACAASTPFYFEEDDDEDLTVVVRSKTGYLRLIELEEDGLLDLHPSTSAEHYIEMYYGSDLMFAGCMQAENFQTEWTVTPREVEFPITSMLGLLDSYYFDTISTPQWLTLGNIFGRILSGADGAYNGVLFPCIGGFGSTAGAEFDYYSLMSLVICPEEKKYNSANVSDYYNPKSFLYFIENICHAFGLICHDDGKVLLFTKFEYTGDYFYFSGSSSYIMVNHRLVDLDSLLDVRGTDNEQMTILPRNKITINYGGEYVTKNALDLTKFRGVAGSVALSGWTMIRCKDMNGTLTFGKEASSSMSITSDGVMSANGAAAVAIGENSLAEYIIFQSLDESWVTGTNVFKWKVYNWLNKSFVFKFTVNCGTLGNWESGAGPWFDVYISCGSYKWDNANQVWGSTSTPASVQVSSLGEDVSVSVPTAPGVYAPIVIEVVPTMFLTTKMYAISDIRIERVLSDTNDYMMNAYQTKRIIQGVASPESCEIDADIYVDGALDHSVIKTTSGGNLPEPGYQYLINTQNRLLVDGEVSLPYRYYCLLYKFWRSSWRWRIIATSFYPWDDMWGLTLHRSSVLE